MNLLTKIDYNENNKFLSVNLYAQTKLGKFQTSY